MKHAKRRLVVCGARPEFALDADAGDNYYLPARMLATLREGDVVVLPGENEALQEFASFVVRTIGLCAGQILWTSGKNYLLDADIGYELVPELVRLLGDGSGWEILPYGVHSEFLRWAKRFPEASILGDDEGWVDAFASKRILHPAPGTANGAGKLASVPGVRVARGYACNNRDDLARAERLLQAAGVARFVVKPIFGATGEGIRFVDNPAELGAYEFPMGSVVLEEHLAVDENRNGVIAPSVQFIGKHVLGAPFDQLVEGVAFAGNAHPSETSERFQQDMLVQTRAALNAIAPTGPGGFDFLSVKRKPVLVDPNLGRLTGAHPVRLFAHHRAPGAEALLSWKIHGEKIGVDELWRRLEGKNIAFSNGRGVFPLCYLPGLWSMLLAVGSSRSDVERMRAETNECLL